MQSLRSQVWGPGEPVGRRFGAQPDCALLCLPRRCEFFVVHSKIGPDIAIAFFRLAVEYFGRKWKRRELGNYFLRCQSRLRVLMGR
jgi:hypothetical protein